MSGLSSIADSWIWYTLCVCALILFVGAVAVLFRSLRDRRKRIPILVSILNLIFIAAINIVFMDCGHALKPTTTHFYSQFQRALFDVPYFVYILSELLSCIVLMISGFEGSKYRLGNITIDSIQQALDTLPEGIALCSSDGTVRHSNLKINELCRSVTGNILTDAKVFWARVEEEGREQEGKYIMRDTSDEVWLIEKESMTIKDEQFIQIIATDVTERYAIVEELEKKNEHLQDVQQRMKAVTDLSGDMFVAQEEADARAALHNQLGQLLLMGRHYINHQDVTDSKIIYSATVQMNQFLLGEAEDPYSGDEDTLAQAISMANGIGVKVDIKGAVPSDDKAKKIISQAITECAANAVKHAEGDTITVEITDTEIVIANNGKPPKGKINESGGLLSLRKSIEAIGGVMELESTPEFKLMIRITSKEHNAVPDN